MGKTISISFPLSGIMFTVSLLASDVLTVLVWATGVSRSGYLLSSVLDMLTPSSGDLLT